MTTATNDGPESGKPVPRIDAVSDTRTRALDQFFAEMTRRDTSQPSTANRPTRVLLPPDSHPQCETPLAYRPASRRRVAPLHDDNPDGPRRIVKAMCVVLLLFAAFCFGGAAWFSSVPDRPAARAAVPASTRVTYVTKNIEDVRKGETVVAWDPVTGELGRHEVTNTFERTSDHLRVLEFAADDDGQTQTLETTDEHPFWSVEAEDFVAAGDLCLGDRFVSPAGEFSRLVSTHRDEHPEGVQVYNFEVADVHNYYVRAHGLRAPPVRVHNASAGICGIGPTSARPAPKSRLPDRVTGALPTGKMRTPDEVKQARNFFERNRDLARKWWEERSGKSWPSDAVHDSHPRALKDGGDPLFVEPSYDNPWGPHIVPRDFSRWGKLGGFWMHLKNR